MSNDLWDTESEYSENVEEQAQEMYDEEGPAEMQYFDYEDEDYGDSFKDESPPESLINEARSRIEQARLYDMLLEHNLFDGVDAIPQVVNKVQKEIKDFIEERYLILSGVKQEKSTEVHVIQDSKFNDMEVQALKMIAAKVTKGASVEAPTTQPKVESQLNAVPKKPPTNKINALGRNSTKPAQAPISRPAPKQPAPASNGEPLRSKPKEERPVRKLKKEMAETSTEGMTINDLAQRDIRYLNSLKNMSLEEAGEVVKQRHPSRISKNAPNQQHINAHYQQSMSMNQTASNFAILLAAAKKK